MKRALLLSVLVLALPAWGGGDENKIIIDIDDLGDWQALQSSTTQGVLGGTGDVDVILDTSGTGYFWARDGLSDSWGLVSVAVTANSPQGWWKIVLSGKVSFTAYRLMDEVQAFMPFMDGSNDQATKHIDYASGTVQRAFYAAYVVQYGSVLVGGSGSSGDFGTPPNEDVTVDDELQIDPEDYKTGITEMVELAELSSWVENTQPETGTEWYITIPSMSFFGVVHWNELRVYLDDWLWYTQTGMVLGLSVSIRDLVHTILLTGVTVFFAWRIWEAIWS